MMFQAPARSRCRGHAGRSHSGNEALQGVWTLSLIGSWSLASNLNPPLTLVCDPQRAASTLSLNFLLCQTLQRAGHVEETLITPSGTGPGSPDALPIHSRLWGPLGTACNTNQWSIKGRTLGPGPSSFLEGNRASLTWPHPEPVCLWEDIEAPRGRGPQPEPYGVH